MKISVLGCGRWGSCIAWYLDKIGHEVLSCGLADAPEFIQLKAHHRNDYLVFPESIEVSSDLAYAVERAEVIIISISSQYLRSYFAEIARNPLEGKTIVLCMKGVEASTGKRLSDILRADAFMKLRHITEIDHAVGLAVQHAYHAAEIFLMIIVMRYEEHPRPAVIAVEIPYLIS